MRIKEGFFDTPDDYRKKAVVLKARGELYNAAKQAAEQDVAEKVDDPATARHEELGPIGRAIAKLRRLKAVVEENPGVKAYSDQGGRVEIARVGLFTPKERASYTREGLVVDAPRGLREIGIDPNSGQGDNIVTPNMLTVTVGRDRVIDKFANLSPERIFKRIARRLNLISLK